MYMWTQLCACCLRMLIRSDSTLTHVIPHTPCHRFLDPSDRENFFRFIQNVMFTETITVSDIFKVCS